MKKKTVLTMTWKPSWFPQMRCSFVYLRCSKHCVCQAQNWITSRLRSKLNREHWRKSLIFHIRQWHTLHGTNISHLGKRKIIFKMPFLGDMLVPWRVIPSSSWSMVHFSLLCSVCLPLWYQLLPISSLPICLRLCFLLGCPRTSFSLAAM